MLNKTIVLLHPLKSPGAGAMGECAPIARDSLIGI